MTGTGQETVLNGYLLFRDRREVIPVLADWIYNEWSFLYPGKTSHYIESLLRKRLNKKKLPITLVAFQAGKPVGTVSLKASDMKTRRYLRPWVASLYVAKRWRGKGVGSSLMKAVEQKAAKLGIRKLFLFTADSDLAARFYSKLGWQVKGKTIYQSYPVIIMEKELS
jgi:GNAT superfamily N-acetyltransferase